MNSNCKPPVIPAPPSPWNRPVVSPQTQTLDGSGAIDPGCDVTYLNSVTPNNNGNPWVVTLPNGNYLRQIKRIYILGKNATNTAEFAVTGTFVGFTSLLFNNEAYSAVLEWDGTAWHLIGGSAQQSNTIPTP